MTLDEAIKHAEEIAEEHTRYNRYGGFESCTECAKEHRQLANWLKELKQLKEQEPCEDVVSRKALIERINNAEDNFIADHQDEMNDGDSFCDGIMSAIFNIREMVAQAPSVTPTHIETVTEFADRCRECGKQKKGKWKRHIVDNGFNADWKCTECGYKVKTEFVYFNYCPNCGSYMKGEFE